VPKYQGQICKALTTCLACNSTDLELILDLGEQPLANDFTSNSVKNERFPLALTYCHDCSHLQLSHNVDRSRLFLEYQYVSGTSNTLMQDFENFATQMTGQYGKGRILDVACNDGSQLDAFKNLGWSTVGVDPATNLFPLSSANHEVYCDFLNETHEGKIHADIALAQNVVAHTDAPASMLEIMGRIAKDVYIQTSQAEMVNHFQYDTIYHEHLSFFSEKSFYAMSKRVDLPLISIAKRAIHGTSFLFHSSRSGKWIPEPEPLHAETIYNYAKKIELNRLNLDMELERLKKSGMTIIGYGAAAKGMTVLNSLSSQVDFIVDDSPLKQNKFAPGISVPIFPTSKIAEVDGNFVLVLLAWNFKDEILIKTKSVINKPFKVLEFFPEVKLYDYFN
jgi:hypothetical protein